MAKKTFILSDQSVNRYGFVVLTSGIDLESFKANPVMFYNHKNEGEPEDVVGKWNNLRIEENRLLAEPEFDTEDEHAKKIEGKVDKGYINGASINLDFSFDDVIMNEQGVPVVTKCTIREASVCPIPGNAGAVRLFANGAEVKDNSVALSFTEKTTPPTNTMKELGLIFAALGLQLSANSTPEHAVEAINALKTAKEDANAKLSAAQKQLSDEQDAKIEAMLTEGVTNKKLSADQVPHFRSLAKSDFNSTKAIVESIVPHVSITAQLNAGGSKDGKDPLEGKTYKQLQKENPNALLAMKANEPERYKTLWQEAFPNGKFVG